MDRGAQNPKRNGALSPRNSGWERACRNIRRGKAEAGPDWLGSREFPYKASRSCFLGSGELARKLSQTTVIGACEVCGQVFPISANGLRFTFLPRAGTLEQTLFGGS